ncbi:MAG: DUF4331 family protein, partial [Vulcanimicrobiaceae bacterium]
MSHHLSGPNLRSPRGDARLDLTDVFVFPAGDDRTVLIMDANPYAPTQAEAYHPDAAYQINVDTDGDNVADIAFSFAFSPVSDGKQFATVYRSDGPEAAAHEAGGTMIARDVPVGLDGSVHIEDAGDYRFFAGLRSDPFFADLGGILNGFKWTGNDSMANCNILGIALEVPNRLLGSGKIGVWCRVSIREGG